MLCKLGRVGELWQTEGACSRVSINYMYLSSLEQATYFVYLQEERFFYVYRPLFTYATRDILIRGYEYFL